MAENNTQDYLLELDKLRAKYEQEQDELYLKQSYQLLSDNKYHGFDVFIRSQLIGKNIDGADVGFWIDLSEQLPENYSDIILDTLELEAIVEDAGVKNEVTPEPESSPSIERESEGKESLSNESEGVKEKESHPNLHLSSKNILYAKRGVKFDDDFISNAADILLSKNFEKINIFRPKGYTPEQQNEFVSKLRAELVGRGFPSEDISVSTKKPTKVNSINQKSSPSPAGKQIHSTFDENGRRIVPVRYEPDLSKNLGVHDEMIRDIESILKANPDGITIGQYMSDLADKGINLHVLHIDGNIGYRYFRQDNNTQIAGSKIVQQSDPDTNLYGYGGECLKNFLDDSDDLSEYFRVGIEKAVESIISDGGTPTQGRVNDLLKNGKYIFTVQHSKADGWKVNYAPHKKLAVQFDFSEMGLSSEDLVSFNFADRLSRVGASSEPSEPKNVVENTMTGVKQQSPSGEQIEPSEAQSKELDEDTQVNSESKPEEDKNSLSPLDFSSDDDNDLLGEMNTNTSPTSKPSGPKM